MNLDLPFDADPPELSEAFTELDRVLDEDFLREVDESLERAARGELLLDLDQSPPSIAI